MRFFPATFFKFDINYEIESVLSMTSTKRFSTTNVGILVAAMFSVAITLGLSPVSSALAQNDILDCDTEDSMISKDGEANDSTSCNVENDGDSEQSTTDGENDSNSVTSSEDDEDSDESGEQVGKVNNVVSPGPAVASSEDNIIKPINLNKGLEADEPLETNNNVNQQGLEGSEPEHMLQNNLDISDKLDKVSETSELYESFDLPYTALYKNQE